MTSVPIASIDFVVSAFIFVKLLALCTCIFSCMIVAFNDHYQVQASSDLRHSMSDQK
jgi:hypothetical protein